MAYRDLTEELSIARRIYIDGGLTNLGEISNLTGIDKKTLLKYREKEKWEDQRKRLIITPQEIALEIASMMASYLEDFKEKRAAKVAIAPSSMKEFLALTVAAQRVDEHFDITGTTIRTIRMLIQFVGELPETEFPDKKIFISMLQQILPLFIAKIERQK